MPLIHERGFGYVDRRSPDDATVVFSASQAVNMQLWLWLFGTQPRQEPL